MTEFIGRRISTFFFKPASAKPLAALRIYMAGCLLVQCFFLRHNLLDFFSSHGILQGSLAQRLNNPSWPQISWLVQWLAVWNVPETLIISFVCMLYFASLILLLIGYQTKIFAVTTWIFHWVLLNSAVATNYGLDVYAHVFLFYLAFAPSGNVWSIDRFIERKNSHTGREKESSWTRMSLRWMQLHLCLTYLTSGIEKAQGPQWRNGEVLWRALTLPIYRQFDFDWLANYPLISTIGTWASLILEIGYCIFIWPRRTRKIWILSIVGMHLSIAIFLGLTLFGALMCGFTLCLFAINSPGTAK